LILYSCNILLLFIYVTLLTGTLKKIFMACKLFYRYRKRRVGDRLLYRGSTMVSDCAYSQIKTKIIQLANIRWVAL